MTEKERLKNLIDNPKQPNVSEWVYEVDAFLEETNEPNEEAWELIDGIKRQGDAFNRCENLVALLRQLYKRKYDKISIPPIAKRNQIFVAMMFSPTTDVAYETAYKPVIQSLDFVAMRIDEKQFNGSIIDEITIITNYNRGRFLLVAQLQDFITITSAERRFVFLRLKSKPALFLSSTVSTPSATT